MSENAWKWLKGAVSAVSGAVVGALGTIVVDPATFEWNSANLKKMAVVSGFTAAVAILNWLAKSPIEVKKP